MDLGKLLKVEKGITFKKTGSISDKGFNDFIRCFECLPLEITKGSSRESSVLLVSEDPEHEMGYMVKEADGLSVNYEGISNLTVTKGYVTKIGSNSRGPSVDIESPFGRHFSISLYELKV